MCSSERRANADRTKMAVKTLRQLHDQWAAAVLPQDASRVQRQECERAFYSGAFACFTNQIAEVAALPDDEAEKAMQALHTEMEDYFRLLRTIPGAHGTQRQ